MFSTDILRVEVSSPSQPNLTLVDLPGLFLAGNKDQSLADSEVVKSIVLAYMKQPRSIILAVVSAKSEFALQQVTQRARENDPDGARTLGLITKPDTLDEGSESQAAYLELAQNKNVKFRHGWHVVRNRDYKTRNSSDAERDAAERDFFASGIWTSLSPTQLGIHALITRLSKLLHDHSLEQLPRVIGEIELGISNCSQLLRKLGDARGTANDQRRYLLQVGQAFTGLVKGAVEGDYSDRSFFGDSKKGGGYEKRLRAQIQNDLSDFARDVATKGNAVTIVDDPNDASDESRPKRVERSKFAAEVNDMMQSNRGRELPGTFNPLVIRELFAAQCRPWEGLAQKCVDKALSAARTLLQRAAEHVADEVTSARLLRGVIKPSMVRIEIAVQAKLDELLAPHLSGHPITYNHYLAENIQKAQVARHENRLKRAFEGHVSSYSGPVRVPNAAELLRNLTAATEPNMDDHASMTAIDVMEVYYKVAMKKFVDDVCVLAVERCLVDRLPGIFSADVICDMADGDVSELAAESPEATAQRRFLTEKLSALEEGLSKLESLGGRGRGRKV